MARSDDISPAFASWGRGAGGMPGRRLGDVLENGRKVLTLLAT